uniref:Ig-like domain-containing protein n=1 Tax=Anabas testudineus TaxID=64144 RepID=A0A3Q1IM78_ANATE
MTQNSCLLFLRSPLRPLRVLVFYLLLSSCRGEPELIGSTQPIVARVGDDVTLPCHFEPVMDAVMMTLEWSRSDLNNVIVYVWRSGQEYVKENHPSYTGRTSLFTDELKHGNISLKLSEVKLSDKGTYKCFIPKLNKQTLVELVVATDAAASPVISLAGIDGDKGGLVLQCESKGWYPEPELLWLDAEGKILSAGPTETVRGPDDLYTVSSRVTVEKRHSNNITCRVQQSNINQTRETQIKVTDDFFNFQTRASSSSSSSAATVAVSVSLAVCLLFIILLVFFLWKMKMISKSKICQWKKSVGGEKKNQKTEEEKEREQLMINKTEQMELGTSGAAPAGSSTAVLKNHQKSTEKKLNETENELKKKNEELKRQVN